MLAVENMFFNEYRHQMDEKSRIRIPAKLKEHLDPNPFITKGPNGCLIVLNQSDAKEFMQREFGHMNMLDPANNKARRLMSSSAFLAEEDKQGRFVLPTGLLKHAGFMQKDGTMVSRNVVTIGAIDHIEIWCEEVWDEYSEGDADDYDACLALLAASSAKADGVK